MTTVEEQLADAIAERDRYAARVREVEARFEELRRVLNGERLRAAPDTARGQPRPFKRVRTYDVSFEKLQSLEFTIRVVRGTMLLGARAVRGDGNLNTSAEIYALCDAHETATEDCTIVAVGDDILAHSAVLHSAVGMFVATIVIGGEFERVFHLFVKGESASPL